MEIVKGELFWPIGDIISSAGDASPTADVLPYLLGACIVLNCPLIAHDILSSMFAKFQSRICADGGSNVIYDTFPSVVLEPGLSAYMPDAVVGDLDSIRLEVRSFFESQGVVIKHVPDQDSTDLDKALAYYKTIRDITKPSFVAIVGTIGSHEGRIDQFFAVLNSMYSNLNSGLHVMSIGNESIMIVLAAGKHRIQVPASALNRHCGVVPTFGRVDRVTMRGFEWDLESSPLEFGVLISTNNILRRDTVYIETSAPILLTFTYR